MIPLNILLRCLLDKSIEYTIEKKKGSNCGSKENERFYKNKLEK